MQVTTEALTEFVLARIAEDEAAAERAVIWRTKNGFAWVGPTPAEATLLAISGHRLLAECEAKRGIVEDFEILHRDYRETHSPTTEARRFQARISMARLALPYADHPDYDEAWRP